MHGACDSFGDLALERGPQRCEVQWPLTRRNCLPASSMPAAHQRSAICPAFPGSVLTARVADPLIYPLSLSVRDAHGP
jgi:hypothetical protein